jgi:hypothetical protein
MPRLLAQPVALGLVQPPKLQQLAQAPPPGLLLGLRQSLSHRLIKQDIFTMQVAEFI